jgi:metal-dependent amidase/aminoacylase/carboxypeptidase family protein
MQGFLPVDRESYRRSSIIDDTYHKYGASLRRISLMIHDYKEVAFQEHQSARLLEGFAEQEGFQVDRAIAGDDTAFVATFTQGNGPVVSFNAVISTKGNTKIRNTMRSPI